MFPNIFLEKGNASNKILFEGYKFQTLSDDGVRLKVDGQTIINVWTNHGPVSYTHLTLPTKRIV
mgnify:CR=1 FL=1